MPNATTTPLFERFLDRIGRKGRTRLKQALTGVSKTLRESVEYVTDTTPKTGDVVVGVPHYWAVYLDQGRGIVRPVNAKVLVWFQNPKDDPRTDGGRKYPVRQRERKRLTKQQYQAGLRENRRRAARGQEPFMIVRSLDGRPKMSGPAQGKHFMDKAFGAAFRQDVSAIILAEIDRFVSAKRNVPRERSEATTTIRI